MKTVKIINYGNDEKDENRKIFVPTQLPTRTWLTPALYEGNIKQVLGYKALSEAPEAWRVRPRRETKADNEKLNQMHSRVGLFVLLNMLESIFENAPLEPPKWYHFAFRIFAGY